MEMKRDKNVGVYGINLPVLNSRSGTAALKASGNNFGNMGIPSIDSSEFEIDMLFDIRSFIERFDFEAYKIKANDNMNGFINLYESNGVHTNFPG